MEEKDPREVRTEAETETDEAPPSDEAGAKKRFPVGKCISVFFKTVLLLLCLMIVLRCCLSADRRTFTEPAAALTDTGETLQTLRENAAEIAPDGYYCAYGFLYAPEAGILQITVRYNDSAYGYTGLPAEEPFSFYLCREGQKNSLTAPTLVESMDRFMYHYQKLVFTDVEIGEANWEIWLDMGDGTYCTCPIRYTEQPLS